MADAEDLAHQLGQTGTQRRVVDVISTRDDVTRIDILRHNDRADGVGVPLRILRTKRQAPCIHSSTHTGRKTVVARPDVFDALFQKDVTAGVQPVQQLGRRCIREISVVVVGNHVLERKERALVFGGLVRLKRPFGYRQYTQTRR